MEGWRLPRVPKISIPAGIGRAAPPRHQGSAGSCHFPWMCLLLEEPSSPKVTLWPQGGVGVSHFPPSSFPESLVLICPQQERKPRPRAPKSLTFSPCSCREWPNPCYCFLLHLNFHLATFPFFPQFLKYFLTFFTRKEQRPDHAFLVQFGERSFVHNIFLFCLYRT